MDFEKIADALLVGVRKEIAKTVSPLLEEIERLKSVHPIHGEKGDPGADGQPGKDGVDGIPGKDGPSLDEVVTHAAKAVDGKFADWVLGYERMANERVQKFLETIPKPADGKDGRDAFSLEDIDLEIAEDGRTVKLAFQRGDERIEKTIRTSAMVYQNVFDEAQQYAKNDSVTWAGSLWISTKENPEGKPGTNDNWKLISKRGRDGKEGPRGPAGEFKVVKS